MCSFEDELKFFVATELKDVLGSTDTLQYRVNTQLQELVIGKSLIVV